MIAESSPDTAELRAQAHAEYRRSLAAGKPLSGVALGEMFGRGGRWARKRIAEVQQEASTSGTQIEIGDLLTADPPPRAALALEGPPKPADPPEQTTESPTGAATILAETPGSDLAFLHRRKRPRPRGYWCSLASFLGGAALSVAANVEHTFHPVPQTAIQRAGAALASAPYPGAVVTAACWPLLLLGAMEVLTRVAWPRGLWWGLARYGGAVMVAVIAGVMSYLHMAGLLTVFGEDPFSAHLGPLAVDGLMIVSGVALLALGRQRHQQD